MGFFSDLKEDISQAMNELITEEDTGKAQEEISLEEMLQNIDEKKVPEETKETVEEIPEEGLDVEQMEGWSAMMNPMEGVDDVSVVSSSMKISGDILSEASLNILGYVKGCVEVLDKLNISGVIEGNAVAAEIYTQQARIQGDLTSSGATVIGAGTVLIGNVSASGAVIAGAVKGDIDVHGPVVLDSTAVVMGNIRSQSVQINNGAVIEGMCSQCYAEVNPATFFDGLERNE